MDQEQIIAVVEQAIADSGHRRDQPRNASYLAGFILGHLEMAGVEINHESGDTPAVCAVADSIRSVGGRNTRIHPDLAKIAVAALRDGLYIKEH